MAPFPFGYEEGEFPLYNQEMTIVPTPTVLSLKGVASASSTVSPNGSADQSGDNHAIWILVGVLLASVILLILCCGAYKKPDRKRPSRKGATSSSRSTQSRPKSRTRASETQQTELLQASLLQASRIYSSRVQPTGPQVPIIRRASTFNFDWDPNPYIRGQYSVRAAQSALPGIRMHNLNRPRPVRDQPSERNRPPHASHDRTTSISTSSSSSTEVCDATPNEVRMPSPSRMRSPPTITFAEQASPARERTNIIRPPQTFLPISPVMPPPYRAPSFFSLSSVLSPSNHEEPSLQEASIDSLAESSPPESPSAEEEQSEDESTNPDEPARPSPPPYEADRAEMLEDDMGDEEFLPPRSPPPVYGSQVLNDQPPLYNDEWDNGQNEDIRAIWNRNRE